VAKRTRASRSARRPGGQAPNRTKKPSGSEMATDPEVSTAEDIGASYSEVEVDEVAVAAIAAATPAQETTTPAQAAPEPTAGRRSRRRAARSSKRNSRNELASRAAAETLWVREDLRRIGVVSIVLTAALAAAYVIFGMLDVLGLY
jgi:hypothetical protein